MGRRALPDQLKELRGTAKKCRKQTDTVVSMSIIKPLEKVSAPAWLQSEARTIFNATAKMLIAWRVLTRLDVSLLATYATAYANMIKADKDIATEKSYYYEKETRTGVVLEMHPAAKMLKDSIDLVNKIGSQFGLSPISRKSLMGGVVGGEGEKKAEDPFDNFM